MMSYHFRFCQLVLNAFVPCAKAGYVTSQDDELY